MTRGHDFEEAATLLKTLSHPLRLMMVCGLLREPATLSQMARNLDVPVSTMAQHLAVLRRCGILEERRRGVEVLLWVVDRRVSAVLKALCAPESSRGRLPQWNWRQLGRLPSTIRADHPVR
jgi:ArsR family transcriptional regulator